MLDASIGPCIEWRGGKTSAGYGLFSDGALKGYAHRIAYCDANGLELADIRDVVVRHKCDNPSCFHPEHLETGTQADNLRDMRERGRARGPSDAKGAKNPSAKLDEDAVRFIRANYVRGSREWGLRALGARFGVSESQAHHIIKRKQWAHVGGNDALK